MPVSASTRSESSLLAGSMMRASTSCRKHRIALGGLLKPERVLGAAQRVHSRPIREATICNGPDPTTAPVAVSRPRSSSACPSTSRCFAAALSASSSCSSCADAQVLDIARPPPTGVHDLDRRRP
jgi:hypothetical protein